MRFVSNHRAPDRWARSDFDSDRSDDVLCTELPHTASATTTTINNKLIDYTGGIAFKVIY